MTKKQLATLKKLLLERQQEILRQFGASSDDIGKLQEENVADWVDRVTLDDAVNSLMSKESDLAKELEITIESLSSIEKGEYGICEECDKQISFERLEAVPAAKLCIDCKNKLEKQQNRVINHRGPSAIPSEMFEFDE
ncbi:MAG: TraR/DksA family transcriptional regulator [bacterium]|jgi:DnaK suppressor protein